MTIEFHLIIGCGAKVAFVRHRCPAPITAAPTLLEATAPSGPSWIGSAGQPTAAATSTTTLESLRPQTVYNVFIANYTVKNNAWTRYRTRSLSAQGSPRPRHTSHSVGADAKLVLASSRVRQGLFVMIRRKYGNRPVPHTEAPQHCTAVGPCTTVAPGCSLP